MRSEQVAEGVFRIPVPLPGNPLRELNAYLLPGGDRPLLIDTGFRQEACRTALWAGLAEHGLKPGEVEVLVTHLHSDHSGMAPETAEKRNIYISETDRLPLTDREALEEHRRLADARFRAEGFPEEVMADRERSNPARAKAPPMSDRYVGLADGQVLEAGGMRLECMQMPGHTPGQMCFWVEEQGLLFTGDHVLFDITPNITAWPERQDSLGDYLASLVKIRSCDARLCLPGHRKSGDLKERVDGLLEHHRCRLEEALAMVKAHPGLGAYELAGYMTWKIRAPSWEEFPVAQKWFAVGECMSHLDHLMERGLLRRETDRGLYRYFAQERKDG